MTEGTDGGEDLPLDDLFEILSHGYRRYILWILADPEGRTGGTVETDRFMAAGGEPDILRLELRHNHLPKLDDAGLVDWNPETGTLGRGPRFAEVEPFLTVIDERDEFPNDRP